MAEDGTYRRSLGMVELVSLGVGGTVGSGIFVVPGVAAKLSGPGSLIVWVIVALSSSCVLLSLSSVAYRFTSSNGFYAVFESVFSSRIAVPLMLLYTVSSVFGVATIAAGIGQYIGFFDPRPVLMIEIAILAAFCVLNIAGIAFSGITETILTALKIIPLVLISLLLLPFVRPENFVQSVPLTMTGLLATVMIVYWPFTGFEISAIPVRGDPRPVADPEIAHSRHADSGLFVPGPQFCTYWQHWCSGTGCFTGTHCNGIRNCVCPFRTHCCLHRDHCYALRHERVYYRDVPGHPYHVGPVFSPGAAGSDPSGNAGKCARARMCGKRAAAPCFNRFEALATISVITTLIPYIFFCIAAWILVAEQRFCLIALPGVLSTAAILILYFLL